MINRRVYQSYSSSNTSATETGAIYGLDVIKQDIISLVSTRKGDFPGDVGRGLIMHDYIFSPEINAYEENIILDDAREQLSEDPRFDIQDMILLTDADTHTMVLSITLYVFSFNEEIEMNIPFRNE